VPQYCLNEHHSQCDAAVWHWTFLAGSHVGDGTVTSGWAGSPSKLQSSPQRGGDVMDICPSQHGLEPCTWVTSLPHAVLISLETETLEVSLLSSRGRYRVRAGAAWKGSYKSRKAAPGLSKEKIMLLWVQSGTGFYKWKGKLNYKKSQ